MRKRLSSKSKAVKVRDTLPNKKYLQLSRIRELLLQIMPNCLKIFQPFLDLTENCQFIC